MSSTINVVASGSSGNCYILTAGGDKLILEAGVSEKTMLKAINYDLEGVAGVLVSHKHNDHAKYIPQFSRYFNVYGNKDTQLTHWPTKCLSPRVRYKIGNFEVMPLEVEHGVQNFAYIIDHHEIGRLVFATDCISFPYVIEDVYHLLIECNFVESEVLYNLLDGEEVMSQYENHMELSETIAAVGRLQNPFLRNVILCHLSSTNSNREIITERFQSELNIEPQFAIRNKIFDISPYGF